MDPMAEIRLTFFQECEEQPQVVITDINMPRMDGFGFIEAVRQDAQYRAIPILVLTTESEGGTEGVPEATTRRVN